jgi:hypothetical protein
MDSDDKLLMDTVRTEALPAQEKVASGENAGLFVTAEQVYAQRIAETPLNGSIQTQGFIP